VKVVFATPTVTAPYPGYLASLEASIPVIEAAGWEHAAVFEIGNPYISAARSMMTRKALDAGADVIIYIDHDLSWQPKDLLRLLETDGEVVAGTYRFKKDKEEYMGAILSDKEQRPLLRADGCIKSDRVPAGFLKVTAEAINKFMAAYPELCYGLKYKQSVDLFNHGAHKGTWYGEDYAFCRNWIDCGGEIWTIPDLNLNHHSYTKVYNGNLHQFLRKQPGGDLA
jgi:glycosyltransferase involved in cell wall biosynthesis